MSTLSQHNANHWCIYAQCFSTRHIPCMSLSVIECIDSRKIKNCLIISRQIDENSSKSMYPFPNPNRIGIWSTSVTAISGLQAESVWLVWPSQLRTACYLCLIMRRIKHIPLLLWVSLLEYIVNV